MSAKYFSGYKKKFFQGWYFKQAVNGHSVAFIPGYAVDKGKLSSAFIQVVTDKGGYMAEYPIDEFFADRHRLRIKIGKSEFSEAGLKIDIRTAGICAKGEVAFSPFNPPEAGFFTPNIMGPFDMLLMECKHYIYSLNHSVNGVLKVNSEEFIFNEGRGYCEGNRGRSFPKNYFWLQSNLFGAPDSSFTLSVADVPFFGTEFCGFASIFKYKGNERRFATYNGAKITLFEDRGDSVHISLKRGSETLEASVALQHGGDLKTPKDGRMAQSVKEAHSASLSLKVTDGGKVIFSEKGIICSAENFGKVRCSLREPATAAGAVKP